MPSVDVRYRETIDVDSGEVLCAESLVGMDRITFTGHWVLAVM